MLLTRLKRKTQINDSIISTILLKPLTSLEITEVIETRHQLGGMQYSHKDVAENFLSPAKKLRLMQRFFTLSQGNIGLALKLWIGSIEKVDENKFNINPIESPELPEFPDEIWKSLLYQFQLHSKLTKLDLNSIYSEEHKGWIERYLVQLVKAGLIENAEKDVYAMPSEIRYFIEKNYAN